MLTVDINKVEGIATLHPAEALSKEDFVKAAELIDRHIETHGNLSGILIHVRSFPGWDSFGALMKHLRFIKDHHHDIAKVAVVTNSPIGGFAERVVQHFIAAEVKHFPFLEVEQATDWIRGRPPA